jgi:ADP-heptose:LPS heptosyltransferase
MRVLLLRLSALGDILRVLPALHALRLAQPSWHITWLCQPMAHDLLKGHPEVDAWLHFPRHAPLKWPGFAASLRDMEFDMALDFHGCLKSALLARVSGARRRIGLTPPASREFAHWLYSERVPCHAENRVEQSFCLLRHLGIEPDGEWVLPVPTEADRWAEAWRAEAMNDGRPYAVLFCGSSLRRYGADKQWDAERFAALGRRLYKEARLRVVFPYGPGEEGLARRAASLTGEGAVLPPPMSLSRLASLIGSAALYVGGDTGPTHLAWLLRTPTVGMFLASPMTRNRAPKGLPYAALDFRRRRSANEEVSLAWQTCGNLLEGNLLPAA